MKKGDKVEFIDAEAHEDYPEFFPPVGTVGTMLGSSNDIPWVQWPEGSTSDDDKWAAGVGRLRLVEVD